MKNENKITFAILKEKISPDNVLAMSELIAISETKYLIGYMGARMQKIHTDLYIDIMHKNDVNHTLSNAYDLVQECGLFLCQHFGKYLKDVIGYTKKGKPINVEMACIRKMMKLINRNTRDFKYTVKAEFIRYNTELADMTTKKAKKELQTKQKRVEELSRLMQIAYEDRLKGKMPEDICIGFIEKYSAEQKTLTAEIEELEKKLSETENTIQSADKFIQDIKKYLNAPTLTREMCYELVDRVVVGGLPKITGKERTIDIVYKIDIVSVMRHRLPK